MILAIDVYYNGEQAVVAAICFNDWESEEIIEKKLLNVQNLNPYIPGKFYRRELPCILKILKLFDLDKIDLIIIDGYVILDDNGKLGLGGYLYEKLKGKIPVIGVAKRRFKKGHSNEKKVLRGKSNNPLYVTSIGINAEESAKRIKNMMGEYRIPNLLKLVDQMSRKNN